MLLADCFCKTVIYITLRANLTPGAFFSATVGYLGTIERATNIAEYGSRMRSISISHERRRQTKTTVRWKQIDKRTRRSQRTSVTDRQESEHDTKIDCLHYRQRVYTDIAYVSVLAERNGKTVYSCHWSHTTYTRTDNSLLPTTETRKPSCR